MLIIGLLLVLIFAGAGFALKILWLGVLVGLVLIVAHAVSGRDGS